MTLIKKVAHSVLKSMKGADVSYRIIAALLVVVVIAASIGISGLAVWLIWEYVIRSIFPSAPEFSYWLCIGISLTLTFIGSLFKRN